MALGAGEAVEADAVAGVGEAEPLEGGEDVAACWFGDPMQLSGIGDGAGVESKLERLAGCRQD